MQIDYTNPNPPEEYHCQYCPNTGVKLWREYDQFNHTLRCANCSSEHEHEDIKTIDSGGGHIGDFGYTHTIGNLIPAIPSPTGFWGWLSNRPQEAWEWWERLPTL